MGAKVHQSWTVGALPMMSAPVFQVIPRGGERSKTDQTLTKSSAFAKGHKNTSKAPGR